MNIKLEIGPEILSEETLVSSHILDLKKVDKLKKDRAHGELSIDLKEEIRSQRSGSGRICIVGEIPAQRQGLGRIPMIAAALLVIMLLNMGQVIFLGKTKGKDALALAGQAFGSLKGATESVISGEEGADSILFGQAEKLFAEAQEKSKFLLVHQSEWLSEPGEVKSLRNLLKAGTLISEVGQNISEAKNKFSNLPVADSLTEYINKISLENLEPAAVKLLQINSLLAEVNLSATDYETKFLEAKEKIKALSAMFQLWVSNKNAILTMLGDRYPQRYLVLLMNNDEMRPGGGFIGSYVLADINDGRLANYEFHDVYNLDGGFHEAMEIPIHELKNLSANWRMRDSNISPDFTYSAQKAAWFLEEEGGPGVDGVIAVNLSSAQAFLEETGPLKIPSLSKSISAEAIPVILSTLVESKAYGKNSPKTVLAELVTAFVEKTKDPKIQSELLSRIALESSKKQILAFHKFPEVENLFKQFGLDGAIPHLGEIEGDFLMPIFTNIGANKSDRYMKTQIGSDTEILSDNGMVGTVTISRTHTFTPETLTWIKNLAADFGFKKWDKDLQKVMGDDVNKTGIRIYIPEGSEILSSSGLLRDDIQFYYDPIQEISYYYTEMNVLPGKTNSITITYSLPWKFAGDFKEYNFKVFKQPGLKNVSFTKTFSSESRKLLSSYPIPSASVENSDYNFKNNFENDMEFKVLYAEAQPRRSEAEALSYAKRKH